MGVVFFNWTRPFVSFHKYILKSSHGSDAVPGAEDTLGNKTYLCIRDFYNLEYSWKPDLFVGGAGCWIWQLEEPHRYSIPHSHRIRAQSIAKLGWVKIKSMVDPEIKNLA